MTRSRRTPIISQSHPDRRNYEAAVVKQVEWSRAVREECRRRAAIGGSPSAEFDEVGRTVAAELDQVVRVLTDLRDGSVSEVNAALADELREMEAFRATHIGGWPWSHLPLPPSDPAMLAAARAEILRGEGIPIEELIRRIEAGP